MPCTVKFPQYCFNLSILDWKSCFDLPWQTKRKSNKNSWNRKYFFLSSAFVSSSDSTECFRTFHISMFLDHLWLITETSLRCVCFSQSESDWTRIDFPSQETPSYSALTRTTNKAKNKETGKSLHKFRNYKLSILKSFGEVVSVVTFLIFWFKINLCSVVRTLSGKMIA